ncbi:MAG: DUF1570 domain-containing protein [Phycisphaerales bacterium]|nr:DUF1570 domain-containing protein [Phycisphaerales bacterium]
MGGRTRARNRRAWSVAFTLTGAAAGLLATGPHQPSALVAPVPTPWALLRAGDLAAASGDLAQADAQYRRARLEPESSDRATRALRDLHRRPEFRLPVDAAAVARTEEVLGPGFRRFDTGHFVVISDGPAAWSRNKAALLERARSEYFRATDKLGLQAVPHATKLVCVLINDHDRYRRFGRDLDGLDASWIAGYYSTAGNRVVFYNDSTSPAFASARAQLDDYDRQAADARRNADTAHRASREDLARQLLASADDLSTRVRDERRRLEARAAGYSSAKTIHECVHLLSFNTGAQRRDREYPLWLSEGLATNFETESPQHAFGPDRPQPPGADSRRSRLIELVRRGQAPALTDLLVVTAAPQWNAETADAMYALSDALFAHLYRREPAALGAYFRDLGQEPPGPVSAQRNLALFAARFGDPAAVERALYAALE